MSYGNGPSTGKIAGWATGALVLSSAIVGTLMYVVPQYGVYSQRMKGEAILAQATSERRVAVEEALALKDSAVHKAAAEAIRAQGVANANKIIADGLGGPEGYLRYLWIDKMASGPTTVYIPTSELPVTEAARLKAPRNE